MTRATSAPGDFEQVRDPLALPDEPGVRTARIPIIASKEELLDRLAAALPLPDYFGHNWDALEECLRDLSWIAEPTVRIVHAAVPPLPVYLEILHGAVAHFRALGTQRLRVVFPSSEGVLSK